MINFFLVFVQYILLLLYIIEGYFTWLINIIFKNTSLISKHRLSICKKCLYNKNGICVLCGCIIKAKTRVTYPLDDRGISIDGCPLEKW